MHLTAVFRFLNILCVRWFRPGTADPVTLWLSSGRGMKKAVPVGDGLSFEGSVDVRGAQQFGGTTPFCS